MMGIMAARQGQREEGQKEPHIVFLVYDEYNMKEHAFAPVSYTHLDVYKRQVKMGVDTLALVTKILVLPAAESVKLPGFIGKLFPVMSGFDIAKDLTKSIFFFVLDGSILSMDRNANTTVDFMKDIDEIKGVKDTAGNLLRSFNT